MNQYEELMPTSKDPSPPRVLVFSHLLAYLETYKSGKLVGGDGDKVNMENVRRVWWTVKTYLRLFQ